MPATGEISEATRLRFFEKVRLGKGCWEWLAGIDTRGYGRFRLFVDGKREDSAHRAAWLMEHGPIPDGLCVLHHCDNRRCVRPSHLYLGTKKDNANDREIRGRGRQPNGEAHGKAKLTKEDVLEIRRLYQTGLYHQAVIAKRLGIAQTNVSAIVRRETWKHI